ncbi:uncharacterized membrane protein YsdA (DUF1294 family) [Bacillus pakistanensis]|uniref:Uncharacterized membrane protein YsdA (DUF1294 family) n=1 Tax=Rossellomorea pakistanensis TaxID=992288 RepID=A0ABS2NAQ7_9BACI|nr:DUF1294 domain-containing protein [Bacillus pakistanensis]MBM7584905.1 uncharacterized membrane protein YsdA (DUF1294 family) [Bacillus pakistanensis]
MDILLIIFILYLLFINIMGYITMGLDKNKSKKQNARRIPEKTIWRISLLGGALGTMLGMNRFRHKTKHRQFSIGLPLLAIFEGIAIFILYGKISGWL